MVKLIQKTSYIKGGAKAGGYLKYISTREGVETLEGSGEPTPKQKELIENILKDFPDSRELFEYKDYRNTPCVHTASAFISTAIDYNAESLSPEGIYMKYIATRPSVEKHGEHGLFGSSLHVDLDTAQFLLERHEGNVWTFIFSLRREDAERLGYAEARKWQALLASKQTEIAEALNIPMKNFRWYAAYHDTDTHPHIHMMAWSDEPNQGYLTDQGVTNIRSMMTNEIFRDELMQLYQEKDISYKELRDAAQDSMRELISQMENSLCASPVIEQRMAELVPALGKAGGKKQYGYLKKPVKEIVDAIVDELARQPQVAQCYEEWNRLRDELESCYKDKPREHLPLSQQKEFKAIKNMVVQEAENIRQGVFTFEDEDIADEPEPELYAKEQEDNNEVPEIERLERLWRLGWTPAAYRLGQLYRDGKAVYQDRKKAKQWFTQAAQAGSADAEYALGKLLLEQHRSEDGLRWLDSAADHGNTWAMVRIGKELLAGEHVPKDVEKAAQYLSRAARLGNATAQYALGKLLLEGKDLPRNKEEAQRWLELSAAQGNPYATFLMERADEPYGPSILLSATKLLYHMSRIFRTNSVAPANPQGIRIDSRRRKALMEKRLALGHKIDDHEDYVPTQTWEQSM